MVKLRFWRAACIFCFLASQLYVFSLAYDWTSTHVPRGFLAVDSIIVLIGPAIVTAASIFLYRLSYSFESKRKDPEHE